jgi:hypothetical protein
MRNSKNQKRGKETGPIFESKHSPQLLERDGDLDAIGRLRGVERYIRVLRSHFRQMLGEFG